MQSNTAPRRGTRQLLNTVVSSFCFLTESRFELLADVQVTEAETYVSVAEVQLSLLLQEVVVVLQQ